MSVSRVIRTRANLPVLLRRKAFPPAKPVIRYISKEGVAESGGSVIGPFNEGERLVLLCEVSGGPPPIPDTAIPRSPCRAAARSRAWSAGANVYAPSCYLSRSARFPVRAPFQRPRVDVNYAGPKATTCLDQLAP
ncbi:hypothetical protein HPB51_029559 [Rhipicephalus microplus]|uniref:Uncharacterized protein n=1 Tax=Rhipicephalus microplus TaxID=6941 RepID=A0A9J6CUN6_RHIMP|nr:hypothetical protein HPB51_029559 [Rhipicephalus microplus]